MFVSDIFASLGSPAGEHPWKVLTQCDEKGNSELVEKLMELKPSEMSGFIKVLEMVSKLGPERLPSSNRHEIDKAKGIYEFIKGNYRVAWFYDEGNIIICSHLFRKKTRKSPKSEVAEANRLKINYKKAKDNKTLTILEDHI